MPVIGDADGQALLEGLARHDVPLSDPEIELAMFWGTAVKGFRRDGRRSGRGL